MNFVLIVLLTLAIPVAVNLLVVGTAVAKQQVGAAKDINAEILRPLLNSERIRLKFGSYGIEVLQNGERLRVSNLYSGKGKKRVTRTLAVVSYPAQLSDALSEAHQEVVSGQSLGEVFKRKGWQITKEHLYFGELAEDKSLKRLYQRMGQGNSKPLAVHIYRFKVSKGSEQYDYATIAEVHHPDYLEIKDLKAIYPNIFKRKSTVDNEIQPQLEKAISALQKH